MTETPSIAPVPDYWTRTSRKPILMDGTEWRSWRVGPNQYRLAAEHQTLAVVGSNPGKMTFSARVGGTTLGSRYRSETAAMLAAIEALKGQ